MCMMTLSDFVFGNVINMKPHGEFIHSFFKMYLSRLYYTPGTTIVSNGFVSCEQSSSSHLAIIDN